MVQVGTSVPLCAFNRLLHSVEFYTISRRSFLMTMQGPFHALGENSPSYSDSTAVPILRNPIVIPQINLRP